MVGYNLLTAAVAVKVEHSYVSAKAATTWNEVVEISRLCDQYKMIKANKCPKNLQDLVSAGLIGREKRDPWGNAYTITCPGAHDEVDVTSNGPDGRPDTGDDIKSWQKPHE